MVSQCTALAMKLSVFDRIQSDQVSKLYHYDGELCTNMCKPKYRQTLDNSESSDKINTISFSGLYKLRTNKILNGQNCKRRFNKNDDYSTIDDDFEDEHFYKVIKHNKKSRSRIPSDIIYIDAE